MEYISSDTNIWIDFHAIDKIDVPFRLDVKYIMFHEAMRKEIIDPPELVQSLVKLGLEGVNLSTGEFYDAMEMLKRYQKISQYDAIALAIAKSREITLLSGDKSLRSAADKEGVTVLGSIGLIDRLLREKLITNKEYYEILSAWENQTVLGRRLPIEEIRKRLKRR